MEWEQEVLEYLQNASGQDNNREEIAEIIIEKMRIPQITNQIKGELEKFTNLTSLALNECELENLQNMPDLPKLQRLELCGNKIFGAQLKNIFKYNDLLSLAIRDNFIQNMDCIQELSTHLKKLIQLDIYGTAITNDPLYFKKIFVLFPNLIYVDNFTQDNQLVVIPANQIVEQELIATQSDDSQDQEDNHQSLNESHHQENKQTAQVNNQERQIVEEDEKEQEEPQNKSQNIGSQISLKKKQNQEQQNLTNNEDNPEIPVQKKIKL